MLCKPRIYAYKGVNYNGEVCDGQIYAVNFKDALSILRERSIILRQISRVYSFKFLPLHRKISRQDITAFTQQVAATLSSGISFIQALRIASSFQANHSLQQILVSLVKDVEAGQTFANALYRYRSIFGSFYCSLITVGEKSGAFNLIFTKLASHLQYTQKLKKHCQKILIYPMILTVITIVITGCLLLYVVPQFAALFMSFGSDLPFATKLVIAAWSFINNYWKFVTSFSLIIVGLIYSYYKKSLTFKSFVDRVILDMPIIGRIYHKVYLAKFTNVLYITFATGLSLVDSLQLAKLVIDNQEYLKFISDTIDRVVSGEKFNSALGRSKFFPEYLVNMLSLGVESSSLENMLQYTACFYEAEALHTFDNLNKLLEPSIMLIMGSIIGFLVLAIYYPIIQLGALI